MKQQVATSNPQHALKRVVLGLMAAASMVGPPSAIAAVRVKANNASNLNTTASWVGGAVPGAFDVGLWSNTVVAANDVLLGGDLAMGGLALFNPGDAVSIAGTNLLTLGVFGIDMTRATRNLTIVPDRLALATNASVSLNITNGVVLALSPTNLVRFPGALLAVTNLGTVATATITNDATGLIGTWARYGAGANTKYATVAGGAITGYAGVVAATAADVVDAGGTTNYDVASVGLLGAGASFNTLRYAGAAGVIGGAFSANGLLNAGAGALSFSEPVTVGADRELVLTSPDTTRTLTLSGAVSDNGGGASGVTIAGGGRVVLAASNGYSGVTVVGAGILAVTNAGALGTTDGNTVIYSTGSVGNNGGQLSLAGGVSLAEPITLQGPGDGAFGQFTRAIDSTSGTNTVTGAIILTGSSSYRLGATAGVMHYGPIQRSTAGGGTLIVDPNSGAIAQINAPIDNNLGGLTCHGSGIVVLNASNNDLGGATVQNSTTLKVTATDALATNQNLQVGQSAGNTASGLNNDVGTFFLEGVNQTINALVGYSNGTANASASDKRKITSTATNAMTLTVGNANGGSSFDGVIENGTNGGSLALTKVGSGAQTLAGTRPNTYTGLTTVNGGTLNLNKVAGTNAISGSILIGGGILANLQSHQIADTATVTLSATNAQWSLGGFSETVANVDVQNAGAASSIGFWTGTGGKLTVLGTLTHALGNITLNSGGAGGTIAADAVVNTGGTWLFGGASGATQSLLIGTGGLTLGGGSTVQVDAATNAPNFIGLGGDVSSLANAIVNTISGAGQLRLDGSRTFTVADGVAPIDLAIASPITDGTGVGSLIKEGAGTLNLSGSNSYSGTTVANAGTLTITSTNALPGWGTPGRFLIASGAALAVPNGVNDEAIATVLGTGNFAAGGSIGFDTTAGNRTYASNLVDTGAGALGLIKLGTNALTLSGTNTFTGMTIIRAGILSIASTNALPGWDTSGRYHVASNATLAVGTGVSSANVDTVLGTTNFAGGANIGFDTSAGSRAYGSTIGNSLNGTLGVVKVGTGALTLSGTNSYDGVTTVTLGTLLINNANALGSTNGNTVIHSTGATTSGGQLSLSGGIAVAEPIVIAGPGDAAPYSLALQTAGGGGSNTLTGPITIATGGGVRLGAGGAGTVLVIQGPLKRMTAANSLQITVGGDNGMVVVNTLIENNGGDLALPGGGRGIVQLNVASNIVGNAQIAGKHELRLGVSDALAVTRNLEIGYVSAWNEADIGTFNLAGFNQTINQLSGNGTSNPATARVVTNSALALSTLTLGNGNGSASFNGLIAGNIALKKVGTGTQTLVGNNSYTGATTVSNGTLALTGNCALASTSIEIGAGARLSVTGRVDGALNLASGQTLFGHGTVLGTVLNDGNVAPGASAGALAVAGDYVQVSGTLTVEIGGTGAGTHYDQLVVSNSAALAGTLDVSLIGGFVPVSGNSFTIIAAAGGVSGAFGTTNLPAVGTPGLGWTVDYLASSVVLSVTGTPTAAGFDLYALQITNAAERGYAADPDLDGYVNLLEYVTGGSPTNADQTARLTAVRTTNAVFALRFSRDTSAVDATLYVEGSDSCGNGSLWTGIATNSGGSWGAATNVSEVGPGPVIVTVWDTAAPATNRFLRLRIVRP